MAVSPLVMPSGTSDQHPSARKTKPTIRLKAESSEANNGTVDLAEQLNEIERRKYIKGLLSSLTLET